MMMEIKTRLVDNVEQASGHNKPQEGHVINKNSKAAWATYTVEDM